jgi:curved DNA-binding protein CbpA
MSDPLDRLDYYALFEIEPGASPDAIRAAFHAFARRYHPDRFRDATDAKRERAGTIYRRGAEAYRVLMSAESRRRYDEGLDRGELRLASGATPDPKRPASTTRLTVTSPRARPFATKAQEAWKAGDYKTAKLNLKLALTHEPENLLLKARLADVEQKLR